MRINQNGYLPFRRIAIQLQLSKPAIASQEIWQRIRYPRHQMLVPWKQLDTTLFHSGLQNVRGTPETDNTFGVRGSSEGPCEVARWLRQNCSPLCFFKGLLATPNRISIHRSHMFQKPLTPCTNARMCAGPIPFAAITLLLVRPLSLERPMLVKCMKVLDLQET